MKFNALVPELSVSDFEKSLAFYVDVLGFKIEYQRLEDKFAYLSYGQAQLMIEEFNGNWNVANLEYPYGRGINFQIEIKDVRKIAELLEEHNIKPFKDIFKSSYKVDDVIYEQEELLVLDLDGYMLRFSQDL